MPKSRGRNASINGAYNEKSFNAMLECAGVQYDTQFAFNHPWGKRGFNDVLIRAADSRLIVVQNKNQNTSGTCDEKIPFQFDVARWSMRECRFDEFWLVLGGTYWSTVNGAKRVAAYKKKADEFRFLCQEQAIARVFIQPSRELTVEVRRAANARFAAVVND